ncbi:hypothetical protein A374_18856 [Fictibacillus macauensis ZFHKF-1]|uniref:Uncharacterized protein n=1 Tax=Fictibacillus macauensis ZFHKF-1 TaxID=1196324 RepID=I8AEL6_9BACL|nr:hypothetical protein [Fictibacillus macauensis]EIT83779.1 hypothetical protein A374_18856 [Fictibacillus macauensis ZFHKF-1]
MNVTDNVGSTEKTIVIDQDELVHIFKLTQAIQKEIESKMTPSLKKIRESRYYLDGKASKAMEVYDDANERITELNEHYYRAFSLINQTLETMMALDHKLAEKIGQLLQE